MPKEPKFSTKEIVKKTPKKAVRKKPVRKTTIKKTPKSDSRISKNKEIDDVLSSIYADNKGNKTKMEKIEIKKSHPILKFLFTLLILGAVFAGVAWFGFFTMPQKDFNKEEVKLEITGPENTILGATTTYFINYKNNQKTKLENTILTLRYPNGFEFENSSVPATNNNNEWNLGELDANDEGQIKITGHLYGSLNEKQSLRAFLNYKPTNFNSELQAVNTLSSEITNTPYELTITGNDEATVGNEIKYEINIKSEEGWSNKEFELNLNLPENFYIVDSKPKLENNKWTLQMGETTSTDSLIYTFTGTYSEDENIEDENIIATLFYIAPTNVLYEIYKSEINTLINSNALRYNLATNGSLKDFDSKPGEELAISVNVQNTSKQTYKDASIKLLLDAPSLKRSSMLDWASVYDILDGDIQGIQLDDSTRRGQVIWGSRHNKKLALIEPNDTLTIDMTLPIKDANDIDLVSLSNYLIKITSEINFIDEKGDKKTINSNPISITINSNMGMEVRDKIATNDNGKTQHNITWVLTNSYHALKDIKITANVYGDVSYIEPEDIPIGVVNWDEDNQKITWEIDELPLNLDSTGLSFGLVLEKINPTQETLVTKPHIQATDSVTEKEITLLSDEISLVQ